MQLDASWMVGRVLGEVSYLKPSLWRFAFGDGGMIQTESAWRIIVNGHIALSSEDHGQWYGQPTPVDAEARARSMLLSREIQSAEVRQETRDIVIAFVSGERLEILPISSGYESWEIYSPTGSRTVAQGGGNLVAS